MVLVINPGQGARSIAGHRSVPAAGDHDAENKAKAAILAGLHQRERYWPWPEGPGSNPGHRTISGPLMPSCHSSSTEGR